MLLNNKDREWLAWLVIVGLVVISAITGVNFPIPPAPTAEETTEAITAQGVPGGVTDLTGLRVIAPTTVATATPAAVIDSNGVSNLLEVRDAATPVFSIADGGDLDLSGALVLESNKYPLENAGEARIAYFGVTSAFTGTTQILSTTHGCTTAVSAVLCQVDDPDDDGGDAFACVGSVTDGDVTLTAVDTAGDTATETGTTAYYIIVGN